MADGYSAVIYRTTTGQIVADIPVADQPTWTRQLNQAGSISSLKVLPGSPGTPDITRLRNLIVPKVFSAAVLWGDYVCQAGPILPYDEDDTSNMLLEFGTGSFWSILSDRLLHHPDWDPASKKITDASADLTITDSLPNIALTLVRGSVAWTHRAGSALPVDIPTNSTPAGTAAMTYYGYDMVSVGQRLTELTQLDKGPDIDFRPYLYSDATGRYVRHEMRVGRASDGYLVQPGTPPKFDYGSSLRAVKISGDGSSVATSAFVKGSGDQYTTLSGYATNTTLTELGWPAADFVDQNHIDATDQNQLTGWATADLALHGKATEQWTGYVDSNTEPRLGSYEPGTFGTYNITAHPWLPEGAYSVRILGLSSGRGNGEVMHILEGRGPF
jgi:hypothetical protein